MKTNEFLSTLDNPNLIPGIYNYCDRWCERCPMTTRCSVFLTTPKFEPEDFESEEAYFEAVFESMHDSFQLSMDLIQQAADEEGIDLDENKPDESWSHKREAEQSEIKQTPISLLAYEYIGLGDLWLKYSGNLIKALEESLKDAALMELPDRDPEQEAADIRDALEVLHYYLLQIYVKVVRAQTDRLHVDALYEEDDIQKEADGAAKIALIGIDRSIKAWSTLMPHFPNQEDSMITFLSTLQQLQRMVEETFPDARAFKRPGFDD